MNKYLIELIRLQNSVILPGFGALMIGNSKSGKIVFNPHLKFNDGALAKFIVEKDGIDQQTAQNQVARFVREIEAELGKGNSFDIFQFGKFNRKADGTVEFVQDASTLTTVADTKKTASAEKAVATPKAEEKKPVEPKAEEKKAAETKITPKAEEKPKTEIPAKTESLLDKLKSAESKTETKMDEAKKTTEDAASKQIKNSFTPSAEKADSAKKEEAPKNTDKPAEISKNIPLAEASKKDPAAQEKNSFKPATEIKKEAEKVIPKAEEKLIAASDKPKSDPPAEKPADKKADESKAKKAEEKPKKESVKEKFKKDKPQKIKHENPEAKKGKKKRGWIKWAVLFIILGGGGLVGWMYKDPISHFLFAGVGDHDSDSTHATTPDHTHDTTATHVTEPVDTMAVDTTMVIEEIIEEPVETTHQPVVNHSSPGGSYHIIGGSFSSEENADNYVKKMAEKGYSAQNLGKHNGLYLVSLKSFGSREEAKNDLSSVKADASGAYIFKGN